MPTDKTPPSEEDQAITQAVEEVVREYGSQADYIARVGPAADARTEQVGKALRDAFASAIHVEEVEVVDFQGVSVMELARAIERHPVILKPLLAVCNIAGRAIERDLDLRNIDTYGLKLSSNQAHAIAGYIKPFLPPSLPLPALTHLDRVSFIDKEIRAYKGQWEKAITTALNHYSGLTFKKVKFRVGNQWFEVDSAYQTGPHIELGIDVKRIEARRDIHKRIDEIANKASKFKQAYPTAKFGVIIYYPFTAEHGNIRDRLASPNIDSVQFAGESRQSVNQAVQLLLGKFGIGRREEE